MRKKEVTAKPTPAKQPPASSVCALTHTHLGNMILYAGGFFFSVQHYIIKAVPRGYFVLMQYSFP